MATARTESPIERLCRLNREYSAWKSIRKWAAGAPVTRDISEQALLRMDAIRMESLAIVRLMMKRIEDNKKRMPLEAGAQIDEVNAALDVLGKYAFNCKRVLAGPKVVTKKPTKKRRPKK